MPYISALKDGVLRHRADKTSLKNDPDFKGDKGDVGKNGADGKSAYEIWKGKDGNGNKSETEFLASLKGEKGTDGAKGAEGEDGKSAFDTWKEENRKPNGTKAEFLASLKGNKGDQGVKGDQGIKGDQGAEGKRGKSAYESWKEKPENAGKSENEFVSELGGKKGEMTQLQTQVKTINTYVAHNTHGVKQLQMEHENLKAQVHTNRQAMVELDRTMQKMNRDLRAGIAGATAISFLQSAQ